MSVADSWDRIIAWHEANTYPGKFKLNAGTSEDDIEAFEQTIGASLPEDFRESVLLHDGGPCWLLWYGELLTLKAIIEQWNTYRQWQARGEYAVDGNEGWILHTSDRRIKPVFWNSYRIPVTDNSGDHLTLDLDPAPDGNYGQLINHSHEIGPEEVLAPSWATFLAQVALDLEDGRYIYVEDEDTVAPPGMYD